MTASTLAARNTLHHRSNRPNRSAQRTEAVARFLLAHAVREDGGDTLRIAFPDKHSSLIEARFTATISLTRAAQYGFSLNDFADWNPQHEATAEMDGVGDPIEFEHHHNGKKQDQVQALAEGRLKNDTRHDLSITVEMPLDLTVTPRKRCSLTGTTTIYDQGYDIDGVELEIAWERPVIMRLECKSAKAGRKSGSSVSGSTSGSASTLAPAAPSAQASYPPGGA